MNDFIGAILNQSVPFVRFALLAGIFSSAAFGMIGSLVVVKRISYIAGAVSHATLAGLGFALYMNEVHGANLQPLVGAVAASLLSALIIALVSRKKQEREDTIIGTIWAVGMGLGLLFIARTPGYVDPMSYLFGNILLLSRSDLYLILALDLVVVASCILFYRQFQAIAFDEEFARTRGLNTGFFEIYFILLTALTVVLMVSTVGIVMVIALLTIPPAVSGMLTKRLWKMMLLSVVFCMLFNMAGLATSYSLDLPTGPATIVLAGGVYLVMKTLISPLHTRYKRRRTPGT